MKKVFLLIAFFLLVITAGCNKTGNKEVESNEKAYDQSMTYLKSENSVWSIAGNPLEQTMKSNNHFAPTFIVSPSQATVVSGGELNFNITSWNDDDGDQITFWWKSLRGKFTFWNSSAKSVRWRAPEVNEDIEYSIYVYAGDGGGLVTTEVINVKVLKDGNGDDIITKNLVYNPIVAPAAGIPPVYYPGEDVRVGWSTVNSSDKKVYGVKTCFWLTQSENIPASSPSENINVGTLEPGETKERWTNFYLAKNTSPGYYYIALKNDCENVMSETDENNNIAFLYIWIRPQGSSRK